MLIINHKITNIKIAKKNNPIRVVGSTHKIYDPDTSATINVTINYENDKPFEVFVNSKNSTEWQIAFGRLLSLLMKSGVDKKEIAGALLDIQNPKGGTFHDKQFMPSVVAHIGNIINTNESNKKYCSECADEMINDSGCLKCPSCGASHCE